VRTAAEARDSILADYLKRTIRIQGLAGVR
jgi:hypothetical protein